MSLIVEKYDRALEFFKNKSDDASFQICNLLIKAGKPDFIINSEPRSLTCLIIGGVIGQKIRFDKARQIRSKLYTKLGVTFNVDDIEELEETDWEMMGLEDFQIDTIKQLLRMHQDGNVDLENFKNIDKLLTVKGIGTWTVDNIKIMYMVTNDKMIPDDILLQHDYIVKKAIRIIYEEPRMTIALINKLKKEWTDDKTGENFTGIVNWYIWRYASGIIY